MVVHGSGMVHIGRDDWTDGLEDGDGRDGFPVLDEAPIFQGYRPRDLVQKRKGKN